VTSLLNWLNTHTFLSPSISLMAWLGILAAVGMTTLAVVVVVYLVYVDFQIGRPRPSRPGGA